jgi:hypothetical protein
VSFLSLKWCLVYRALFIIIYLKFLQVLPEIKLWCDSKSLTVNEQFVKWVGINWNKSTLVNIRLK